MEATVYKTVIAENEGYIWKIRLKNPGRTFEQLKEQTAEAFAQGIDVCRFYTDRRKKNDYLEVRKEQFDPAFIADCYKKFQREQEINNRVQRIESLEKDIEWRKKRIEELKLEIKNL